MRMQTDGAMQHEEGADPLWAKVFDDQGCNEGVMAVWRRKYLFPFGDIAPLSEADCNKIEAHPTGLSEMDELYREADDQLPLDYGDLTDPNEATSFERLITSKYRLKPSALGDPAVAGHWFEELGRPICETQNRISKDLATFTTRFPKEQLPHKTNLEADIEKLTKDCVRQNIRKLYLRR